MRRARNQKGFTIMELMIVIVIIGILIAIAVPAYQSFRARAATRACQSNLRTISTAVGMWIADLDPNNAAHDAMDDLDAVADLTPYIDNIAGLACPYGGAYVWDDTAEVFACPNDGTYADHVLP